MNTFLWVLQWLLAAVFMMAGAMNVMLLLLALVIGGGRIIEPLA